ncbi:YD repeat-containing protein, partial [Winogradskyella wandonensis]
MTLRNNITLFTSLLIICIHSYNLNAQANELPYDWTPGSGGTEFYNQNGSTVENERLYGEDPFGNTSLLWRCGNEPDYHADGGWNTDYFEIDNTKTYRYSVWVKRTGSQDGRTYHGTVNVNNLNGTPHTNPYFWSGDLPTLDNWYLLVGIIHPHTYVGSHSNIGGVYDVVGNKILGANDFKWRSDNTSTRMRSYLYYAVDTNVRQYFYGAKFQEIDNINDAINDLFIEEAPSTSDNLNWVSGISYNFLGHPISKNMSFFDETGNGTQSQSWDILTGKVWNSETRYDSHGRPALQTLSAPIGTSFGYKQDFIRRSNGTTYTNSDFENNPENPQPVGNQNETLGHYYSTLNTNEPYQDITSYPYSRTVYSKLLPGNVKKVVGGNKINNQWLQTYSFTMPAPGQASGVTKTVSRDVHGIEVVIFTDAEGNTIKAARSGNEEEAQPINTVTSTIKENGFVDIHISKGCNGITVNNPTTGNTIEVYDLITESIVPPSQWSNLPSGYYRVAVVNASSFIYNPSQQITVQHQNNYYDFSNNVFDKAGRLLSSTQPNGNLLKSDFEYNSLGQLLETSSPDEGTAKFKYRKDGQIRFSQNSKQELAGEFSYTNYDDLGRPVESGIIENSSFDTLDPDNNTLPAGVRKEQQFTEYDVPDITGFNATFNSGSASPGRYTHTFLAGNVSKTYTKNPDTNTTWYSYDIYGRVRWIVQNIEGLGTKTIDYEYDYATGQVTHVIYQQYEPSELFIHRYTYNEAGQLTKVETSDNGSNYITQADYSYYESGALKRTDLANGLQGIDYVYNLNGQLKSINHPELVASKDPGGDSNDLFGMQLDYYSTDYARSQRVNISTSQNGVDQFNGNIKSMRWNTSGTLPLPKQSTYNYTYNKNNWLSSATYGEYLSGSTASNGSFTPNSNSDYKVDNITYDANGNIETLKRNGYTGGGNNNMDNFIYNYNGINNQLNSISDTNDNSDSNRYNDLKNQLTQADVQSGMVNYVYNSIGQLTTNIKDQITYNYNASGLTTKISGFTNENTGEYATLMLHDYEDAGQEEVALWEFNARGSSASIESRYSVTQDLNYICSYLNDTYGKSLNINAVPNSQAKRYLQTIPDVNHRLELDMIALQSNGIISPFGSGNPDQIPVGYRIRILSKSGAQLAIETVNPTLSWINDPDTGNAGGCSYFYDEYIVMDFVTGRYDDKVYLEITPLSNSTNNVQLYLDNLHLQATTETKVAFFYDDKGKRIKKETYQESNGNITTTTTYYVRDVAGNPMGIYQRISSPVINGLMILKEQPIYGASRIGIHNRETGTDLYQLTDHLGNVRAVIAKQGTNAMAITAKTDYYPFGMAMPNRNIEGNYRYGYQGEYAEKEE